MSQYSFGNPPPMGNPQVGEMFGIPPAPEQFVPMRNFRGDALSQTFKFRERLRMKEPLMGIAIGMPSPDMARLLAGLGYDYIFVDWEHTPMGIKELTEIIRWINLAGEGTCAAVVRVPNHDHSYLAWALDAGASAVVVPHTDTVEQAKAAVNSARFYTEGGHRSFPPFALTLGVNDGDSTGAMPWDIWNRAAVIVQLESKKAADNADEICKVPGVDGLMIGHGDLRADLGLMLGNDGPEPEYNACVDAIMAAARTNGDLPVLTFAATPDLIAKRFKQGFRMFMTGGDAFLLATAGRKSLTEAVATVRQVQAEEKPSGSAVNGN